MPLSIALLNVMCCLMADRKKQHISSCGCFKLALCPVCVICTWLCEERPKGGIKLGIMGWAILTKALLDCDHSDHWITQIRIDVLS